MNSTSRIVKSSTENKNVSRLITAMDGWNDKFFTEAPNGVFGSVAIIRCNGVTVNSNDIDLEFQVPF